MVIRSVDSMSLAKVLSCLYAIVGVMLGAVFAVLALVGAGMPGNANPNAGGMMAVFGVASLILFPLIYGAMGFVGGIIMALLYNTTASMVGGIEIEFDRDKLIE